ncbi:hypothetical protein Dimus_008774 [Dionaea muscipula]
MEMMPRQPRPVEIDEAGELHSLLQSCDSLSKLKQIHAQIFRSNLHCHCFLASSLVHLYASLSSPLCIHRLLSSSSSKPSISLFNRAIKIFSKIPSLCFESLRFYRRMVRSRIEPDNFTYPFLFNSCAALCDFRHGAEIHGRVFKRGFLSCIPVSNALIDMYGKCSELGSARLVFDEMPERDVVSCNALLGAHARAGEDMVGARAVFEGMLERSLISWNTMLVGYVNSGDLAEARVIFDRIPCRDYVSWATILFGYTKNGEIDSARDIFDAMPGKKTALCCTAMISGYAQNARPNEALAIFHEMQRSCIKADAVTATAVISALSQLGRHPELAHWITEYIDREAIEQNEYVITALVDLHAKCGNIEEASQLFQRIPQPGVFPYSALITGLASNGHGLRALEFFRKMQIAKVQPDYVTFVGVLAACRHTGLIEEGLRFWDSMIRDHGIEPDADHYACLVDMLGRAGRLQQAYKIIKSMPIGPYPRALGALLGACRTYGNVEIAESVSKELFELEPENTGNYVLLSSIYAAMEQWDDAARVRRAMKEKIKPKLPGSSLVEEFNSRPASNKIAISPRGYL